MINIFFSGKKRIKTPKLFSASEGFYDITGGGKSHVVGGRGGTRSYNYKSLVSSMMNICLCTDIINNENTYNIAE